MTEAQKKPEHDIVGDDLPIRTISYKNVVKKHGLSKSTWMRMAKEGKIRAYQYGRLILLDYRDVIKFIEGLPAAYAQAAETEGQTA